MYIVNLPNSWSLPSRIRKTKLAVSRSKPPGNILGARGQGVKRKSRRDQTGENQKPEVNRRSFPEEAEHIYQGVCEEVHP